MPSSSSEDENTDRSIPSSIPGHKPPYLHTSAPRSWSKQAAARIYNAIRQQSRLHAAEPRSSLGKSGKSLRRLLEDANMQVGSARNGKWVISTTVNY